MTPHPPPAPRNRPSQGALDWGVGCVVVLGVATVVLAVVLVRRLARERASETDSRPQHTAPQRGKVRPSGWSRRVRRALEQRARELDAEIERARAELERLRLEAATSPDPAWRWSIAAKEAELAELLGDLHETRRKLKR